MSVTYIVGGAGQLQYQLPPGDGGVAVAASMRTAAAERECFYNKSSTGRGLTQTTDSFHWVSC